MTRFRSRRRALSLAAGLGVLAAVPALRAQRPAPAATPAPAPAPLFEGMGGYTLPGAAANPRAQRYVDQGMVLAFGFNPAEAARSFESAVALDPKSAAAWWGLAWALGPTINADMAPADQRRVEAAVARAVALARAARPQLRDLVEALALRHPRGRPIAEEAYATRMQALAKRHPDDADVQMLAAEALLNLHPYDWWEADGRPKPWTPQIEALLVQAMERAPVHPGALHYWIHLNESSKRPAVALDAAERLTTLVPGSGHLLHMPAHIFIRTGRYAEASAANRRSIEADARYLAQVDAQGAYRVGYVAHNHHFLYASSAMQGRAEEALAAARAAWPAACGPKPGDRSTTILQHYYLLPLYALVRFGRWRDILTDTLPPDVAEPYPLAIWHYARGTAHVRSGQAKEARDALARVEALAADPALAAARIKNINAASALAGIAALTLRADLQAGERRSSDAIALLQKAVALEDSLTYDEPHLWLAPTRHALGAALLTAGRAGEAERVYREDLAHYPENGWSLIGLARCLRAQGRNEAAKDVDVRFRAAWADADVRIDASRF
ncbi:MAG TPA: tetratricopeptide repeat protein [Casimicrobiaceae bacterium]|nr:tetratricopeptide repeat protein [Casimicrobiaceae bacterium]